MNKITVAVLAGVAIGILIAPEKGERLRARLIDAFNDLADTLEGVKEKFISNAAETVSDLPFQRPPLSSEI